jgi:hypothetical protein
MALSWSASGDLDLVLCEASFSGPVEGQKLIGRGRDG